jgi:D-xylose transport system ATP-binding protein
MSDTPVPTVLLEMRSITKDFGGVRALDAVNLNLFPGEFHAIVGENGAGKSTLMKILSGVYPSTSFSGEIVVNGRPRSFYNVRDAERAGIAIIYQELSLVAEMTVAENIYLGREPSSLGVINASELNRKAADLLHRLDLNIDVSLPVGRLSVGTQQMVEIAKALSQQARVLVLDEPTAALTDTEVRSLFRILEKLKSDGVGLLYISHKLEEVFKLSDRITVLRDGKTVITRPAADLDIPGVISLMVGRDIETLFPVPGPYSDQTVFEALDLSARDPVQPSKKVVDDVSFEVRRGEIVGIAGLMGSGRSELLMTIFGAHTGSTSGAVCINGRAVSIESPSDAIRNGIAFVTEDRKRFGLVLDQSIADNYTLASLRKFSRSLVPDRMKESAAVHESMNRLRVKAASPLSLVGNLSGGNQQKVVLGKWLLTEPIILLLDEPTRGIDIGSKQEIYALINRLAAQGIGVIVVSSELPEVLGLCHRVLVLNKGRLAGQLDRSEASPEKVMALAMGLS